MELFTCLSFRNLFWQCLSRSGVYCLYMLPDRSDRGDNLEVTTDWGFCKRAVWGCIVDDSVAAWGGEHERHWSSRFHSFHFSPGIRFGDVRSELWLIEIDGVEYSLWSVSGLCRLRMVLHLTYNERWASLGAYHSFKLHTGDSRVVWVVVNLIEISGTELVRYDQFKRVLTIPDHQDVGTGFQIKYGQRCFWQIVARCSVGSGASFELPWWFLIAYRRMPL